MLGTIQSSTRRSRKRQSTTHYLTDTGILTLDASLAATFQIINTELYADGALVSVPEGLLIAPVIGWTTQSISTGFSIVNGVLEWTNDAFSDASARWCENSNSSVTVVLGDVVPTGCSLVTLVVVDMPTSKLYALRRASLLINAQALHHLRQP